MTEGDTLSQPLNCAQGPQWGARERTQGTEEFRSTIGGKMI